VLFRLLRIAAPQNGFHRIVAILLASICIFVNGSCTKQNKNEPANHFSNSEAHRSNTFLPQDLNGNFTLAVSNQSFAITPVDIDIDIDGKRAIQSEFDVGSQHNWIGFKFQLSPGEHTIQALSRKGEASLKKSFTINGKHWGVLNYWYYPEQTGGTGPCPRQFSFGIQNKPVQFM